MYGSRLILVNLFNLLVVFVEQVNDVGEEFSYSCGVDVEFDYCWFEGVTHFCCPSLEFASTIELLKVFLNSCLRL